MTLDAEEFIRRFLMHVLPDRFVRLRHYGLLANPRRKANLEHCRKLLNVSPPSSPQQDWKERYQTVTGKAADLCPRCQQGRMICIEILSPLVAWPRAAHRRIPLRITYQDSS
jgi:hypothetical protein